MLGTGYILQIAKIDSQQEKPIRPNCQNQSPQNTTNRKSAKINSSKNFVPHGKLAMTAVDSQEKWKESYVICWSGTCQKLEGAGGGGGVGILNLGSEMRWPIPVMGVKFANHPLELGLKYHDPPHLTELKEKCSRLFKVPIPSQQVKKETKTK